MTKFKEPDSHREYREHYEAHRPTVDTAALAKLQAQVKKARAAQEIRDLKRALDGRIAQVQMHMLIAQKPAIAGAPVGLFKLTERQLREALHAWTNGYTECRQGSIAYAQRLLHEGDYIQD